MKRFLSFLLCILVSLTFVSCSVNEETNYTQENIEEQVVIELEAPEPDRIGDLIVIDSCYSVVHCGNGYNKFITYTAYDEVELVMYQVIVRSTGAESGITTMPLYKADGTLRTYTPDEES